MKNKCLMSLALLGAFWSASAWSNDEYNKVPLGDAQYAQCLRTANNMWEGGNERSRIRGQTKVEAFCTCMWNETPDNFKGNLARFADTPRGKETNAICEKYSGWNS